MANKSTDMNLDSIKTPSKDMFTIAKYVNGSLMSKGTGISVAMLEKAMEERYQEFISKFQKIKVISIHNKDESVLYLEIRIPSEKYDLYYQVILEFRYNSDTDYLQNVPVRVFSNCPSFTYTYAYVFNTRQLLIPQLRSRYSNEVLRREPSQRNTYGLMNYEKSLYYAFRYLQSNYSTIGDILRLNNRAYNAKTFLSIKSDEEINVEYKRKKQIYQKKKALEKAEEARKKAKTVQPKVVEVKKAKVNGKSKTNPKATIKGKTKVSGKSKLRGKAKRR